MGGIAFFTITPGLNLVGPTGFFCLSSQDGFRDFTDIVLFATTTFAQASPARCQLSHRSHRHCLLRRNFSLLSIAQGKPDSRLALLQQVDFRDQNSTVHRVIPSRMSCQLRWARPQLRTLLFERVHSIDGQLERSFACAPAIQLQMSV